MIETPRAEVRLAAAHALLFLVIGNAAGLLLAALPLFPGLGDMIAPLSYGRWAPVHLDVHLYGWGSLPLVALLLAFYAPTPGASRMSLLAVHAWSAMVVVGAASWLMGFGSGKPFLDWSGGALDALVVAMSLLAVALVVAFVRGPRPARSGTTWLRAAMLLALLPVPFVMAWAARPEVYPAINPDSGGPTGVSLMGSVLGIVALFTLTPFMLGLTRSSRRIVVIAVTALALHGAVFAALDHGDRSHREPVQVVALASVIVWIPLLVAYLRAFDWPAGRGWLIASAAWGVVLFASGLIAFLPGVLERWKFSHALVAHAHVALAGLVTSWNMLVLSVLLRGTRTGDVLASRRAASAWHATLSLHLAALAGLAALEQRAPGGLLPAGSLADGLLVLRATAGAGQLAVSSWWLAAPLRRTS